MTAQQHDAGGRPWRLATAGAIGNVLEWYDFAVYGYFAPIIAHQFFPAEDPTISLIAAFGAFAAGFVMRPIGGAVFGYVGDRYGRSRALILSILLMAVPTGLIALLPTYETVGLAAAALMVVLRMAQGMAVGGEYTSSVVFLAEHSPPGRRALYSAFPLNGAFGGLLLASAISAGLSTALSDAELSQWGWRIAFALGVAVAIVGYLMRRSLPATPEAASAESPLALALRAHWRGILRSAGVIVGYAAGFYVVFVYVVTWLVDRVKEPKSTALDINTLTLASLFVFVPLAAWMSDRYGRRLLLVVGYAGLALFAYPLVWLMHHPDASYILSGQIALAFVISLSAASIPSAVVESFPHSVRVTAVSISYNLTFAVFGGTAPMVAVWLIEREHDDLGFVWYLIATAVVSCLVSLTLKDRHKEPLDP